MQDFVLESFDRKRALGVLGSQWSLIKWLFLASTHIRIFDFSHTVHSIFLDNRPYFMTMGKCQSTPVLCKGRTRVKQPFNHSLFSGPLLILIFHCACWPWLRQWSFWVPMSTGALTSSVVSYTYPILLLYLDIHSWTCFYLLLLGNLLKSLPCHR